MKILITTTIMLLTSVVWAFDPSGSYTFKEKGMSGSMTVKEEPDLKGGTVIKVKLDTINSQTNMCDVEVAGERVISSEKAIDAIFMISKEVTYYEHDSKFEIRFTPKGATIKKLTDDPAGCGMNAYFSGKWVKDIPKRKAVKKY